MMEAATGCIPRSRRADVLQHASMLRGVRE
jgi:hypothetical protein